MKLPATKQLTAVIVLALAPAAFADLVTNGGFETASSGPGSFTNLTPGTLPDVNNLLPGWSIDLGGVDHIGSYWMAGAGSNSLDLAGLGPGTISQVLSTVNGQQYFLTFLMAGNPDDQGQPIRNMTVNVGSVASMNYTFDTTGRSGTNMGWTTVILAFTANSTSTTLSFVSTDTTGYGMALDSIAVNESPEPATLLLFAAGLGGLGLLRRSQKRKALAAKSA